MKSGSSAPTGSGGQSAETSASISCSQWSRSATQATCWPVRRTTSTRGSVFAFTSALLTLSLRLVTRPPRGAPSAVMTTLAELSSIRFSSASGEKPAKTIEWIAPIRAQASIATAASGIIGR